MALRLECSNGHVAHVPDCSPECAAVVGAHLHGCPSANLAAQLACPPGEGCCEIDHDHDLAANLGHPNLLAGADEPDHDGDHTAENPDCSVCRPMTIHYLGPTPLQIAGN
jgi:hypothetical protein